MIRQRKQIFIAIGLVLAVLAAAFLYVHFTESMKESADVPGHIVIDLTTIPLVLNDVIFNLERKILEAEFGELKNGELTGDKASGDEYFQDLSDLFDSYKNTYQPEKARRTFILMQSILGEESRLPEYEGPVAWDFEKPTEVVHEGFDLTVDDAAGNASTIFSGAQVTYKLDPAANYFSLLRIKINDPVEIENISFDVSSAAEDIVFKFLGDNGEVSILPQDGRVSLDVSGLTRTLEIAIVYPIPESVTLSGLVIKMREVTEETPHVPKKIG
jgi:hypothetical protein